MKSWTILLMALIILQATDLKGQANMACDAFTVSLNGQGQVISVKDKSGKNRISKPCDGFYLGQGRSKVRCSKVTMNGKSLSIDWDVKGHPCGIDLAWRNKGSYLTFEITKFRNMPEKVEILFAVESANADVSLMELDYMTDFRSWGSRQQVKRGCLWMIGAENPKGSFAVYTHDTPEQADDQMFKIWGNEDIPHPKVDGKWNEQAARGWVKRWIKELFIGQDRDVLAADAHTPEELYELADFAHKHKFRYLWMWCGMWRGAYWLSGEMQNHSLNPKLFPNGLKDLVKLTEYLEKRNMGIRWHQLSGCIAEKSPDFAGKNPKGLLASWGDGVIAEDVGPNDKTVKLKMSAEFKMPVTKKRQWGPPIYPHWMRITCVWLNGELIEYGSMKKSGDIWLLENCKRGHFDSGKEAHKKGDPAVGLLRTYGQDFVPDMNGPLMKTMAARLAGVMNAARIRQIIFDGFENHSYAGGWGRFKYASAVYSELAYPTYSGSSNGNPPPCWLEYRFNMVKKLFARNGRIRTVIDHPSRPAIGPDEVQFALSRHAARGATSFEITGYDVKGIPFGELKQLGLLPDIIEQVRRWKEASSLLTATQRTKLSPGKRHGRNPGATAYKGGADPYSELRIDAAGNYAIYPVHVLRRKGLDVGWSEIGEIGLNGPWQYVKPGEALEFENPYEPQVPSFVLRVWPAFDKSNKDNIDLIATCQKKGTRGNPEAEYEDAVDTMGMMKRLVPKEKMELTIKNNVLLLSASNNAKAAKYPDRVDTRINFRPVLDLSKNRGMVLEVTGDGQGEVLLLSFGRPRKRDYVIPIDFTGKRYFEIPCGQKSWADGFWGKPNKWGKFSVVPEVDIKFGKIPGNTKAKVAIEKLTALREIDIALKDPTIRIGDRTLKMKGSVPAGHYIKYDSGEEAVVYDPNWHKTAELPVQSEAFEVPKGSLKLRIECANKELKPWIQARFKVAGEPIVIKKQ